jgi:hypothetical protein
MAWHQIWFQGTAVQATRSVDLERTAGYASLEAVLQKVVGLIEGVVDSGPPSNSRRLLTAISAQLLYTEWSSWNAWRDFEREERDLPPSTNPVDVIARLFGNSSPGQSTPPAKAASPRTSSSKPGGAAGS